MPAVPLHPCSHPGCFTLTPFAYCPAHAPVDRTISAARRGYDRAHRRWRELILARDAICKGWPPGTVCWAPSTVADHITPMSDGGPRFDLENGQGLCAMCHGVKSSSERRAIPGGHRG